jgi:Serine dehydrogenase proteinase
MNDLRPVSAPSVSSSSGGNGKVPPAVPEFLPQIINCHEEKDPAVVEFATREKTALVAFIAPQVPVRIFPADTVSASIGLLEEFGVEALVNKLRETGVERAYLLVNSPGGQMDSSYKIALAVREALSEVTTFVPHVAASGGTLLAVAGNEIVMGPMSHITPLDSQVRFNRAWISAASGTRFYQRAIDWFEKKTPEEAPYPQRALTEKLDPYLMEEWRGVLAAMTDYVTEILTLSGYKDAEAIAGKLVMGYPTHAYVLNKNRLKRSA